MLTFVLAVARKYMLAIVTLATLILSVIVYGKKKEKQGYIKKESQDREEINEAVQRKNDRRVLAQPVPIERRRDRVRSQRDQLTELLRSD